MTRTDTEWRGEFAVTVNAWPCPENESHGEVATFEQYEIIPDEGLESFERYFVATCAECSYRERFGPDWEF